MSTVRADFFLDPRDRLTEQERALMTAMLADLLGGIAGEIRARLPGGRPANDDDGQMLLRRLGDAGLLDDERLIALLLRRADEERITSAVRARSGGASSFLQALISDDDAPTAAAAMALILARGRRRDRLGQPRLDFDDLPAAVAEPLAHSVAAALRGGDGPAVTSDLDADLSAAAEALFTSQERARSLDALTSALARELLHAGKLDEVLIAAAAEDGEVGLAAAALAQSARIDDGLAWDHLLDPSDGRFVLVLRMAGLTRDCAARVLVALGDLVGIGDLGGEIARFDDLDFMRVESERNRLQLNPHYRAALSSIGGDLG